MSTDTQLLGKGLIRLGILVFLFIASPIILTMGFKAFDRFSDSPKIYIAYLLILAGFTAIIFSIYFAFKTFKKNSNSLFNDK